MSKGTVIYIGGFELPDKNAAAHRVIANGKIFRNLGYDVIYVGVDRNRKDLSGPEKYQFAYEGFECWSVPYPSSSLDWLKYISGQNGILEFIEKRKKENIKYVICYNYPAIAQLRINSISKKIGAKTIADATEWYGADGGSVVYRLIKYSDTTLRMYYANVKVDGVITTSKYLTDFYNKRHKKTVELPTLFDTTKFVEPVCKQNKEVKNFIYFGSPFDAGRVNKRRTNLKERLDRALLLFYEIYMANNVKFKFDIYGLTKEDYLLVFPEHRGILAKMEECVAFHGKYPHDEILKKISASDFSIFFRDKTRVTLAGFPTKLAESVSCGTPVLTNRMLSIEKFVDQPFIFSSEFNNLQSLLRIVFEMSREEIIKLKEKAFLSKIFDFSSYEKSVEDFISNVRCE